MFLRPQRCTRGANWRLVRTVICTSGWGTAGLSAYPDINMNAQDPTNLYGKILRINSEVGVIRPERATRLEYLPG